MFTDNIFVFWKNIRACCTIFNACWRLAVCQCCLSWDRVGFVMEQKTKTFEEVTFGSVQSTDKAIYQQISYNFKMFWLSFGHISRFWAPIYSLLFCFFYSPLIACFLKPGKVTLIHALVTNKNIHFHKVEDYGNTEAQLPLHYAYVFEQMYI